MTADGHQTIQPACGEAASVRVDGGIVAVCESRCAATINHRSAADQLHKCSVRHQKSIEREQIREHARVRVRAMLLPGKRMSPLPDRQH